MELREAAQQAIDALELGCTDHDGNPVDLVGPAITALRAALSNTQDWDEIDALRASLREHMAEIHRLRTAGWHAYYALSEIDSPLLVREITRIGAAMSGLRAALAEEKNENTVQSTGGVHSRVSDGANRGVEAVTDCHEKAADHIPDATKMMASVREHRTVGATIKDCLIVEPVGYGVFEDGNLHDSFRLEHEAKLFAALKGEHAEVGALYRSPPKREPLMDCGEAGHDEGRCGNASCITRPQRKPLTEKQIESAVCGAYVEKVLTRYDITIARAIERAHGIGGEEMTREDIISMARECGLYMDTETYRANAKCLERFAALVAEHEREACAKVCLNVEVSGHTFNAGAAPMEFAYQVCEATAFDCAAAIRARGEK